LAASFTAPSLPAVATRQQQDGVNVGHLDTVPRQRRRGEGAARSCPILDEAAMAGSIDSFAPFAFGGLGAVWAKPITCPPAAKSRAASARVQGERPAIDRTVAFPISAVLRNEPLRVCCKPSPPPPPVCSEHGSVPAWPGLSPWTRAEAARLLAAGGQVMGFAHSTKPTKVPKGAKLSMLPANRGLIKEWA